MAEKLKRVSCDPMCGFMVQSHDENELVGFVKNHVKNVHSKTMSDSDIRGMMKNA